MLGIPPAPQARYKDQGLPVQDRGHVLQAAMFMPGEALKVGVLLLARVTQRVLLRWIFGQLMLDLRWIYFSRPSA